MHASHATFHHLLQHMAETRPDEPAFASPEGTLSHAQFLDRVERLSAGLETRGLAAGDRLCILAGNSVDYFVLIGACARCGAIAFPLNTRLSAEEIGRSLALAEPKALIVDAANLEKLEGIALDSIQVRATLGDASAPGFLPLGGFFAAPAGGQAAASSADPFVILTTAAVEGTPRGAVLSHENLLTAGEQIILSLGLTAADRHLAALPLFHVTGLVLAIAALQAGGANAVLERFDPHAAARMIDELALTYLASFPPMLATLLDARRETGASWSTLRFVLGLDAPEVIQRLLAETHAKFWTGFGQSETSGVVTLVNVMEKPGSAGRPLPAAQVRCFDETGEELPVGSPGEIVVRGPLVFRGYWRDPDATAFASRDGWHHTGDMGRFDEDGYLYYLGRKPEKDLIKTGGENVYPAEVEHAIASLPQVSAVCVIGVPDDVWGEAVKAVVEVKLGEQVTAEKIVEAVTSRIAGYKKPRHVEFVEALPRTPEGRIDRQAVIAAHG